MNPETLLGWFGFYWLTTAVATSIIVEGRGRRDITAFDILQGALWSTPICLTLFGIIHTLK